MKTVHKRDLVSPMVYFAGYTADAFLRVNEIHVWTFEMGNDQAREGRQRSETRVSFYKAGARITTSARSGGPDPEANSASHRRPESPLRKHAKDNIDRAIERATGAWETWTTSTRFSYEGYAPGGIAVVIRALTDNSQSHRRRGPLRVDTRRRHAGRNWQRRLDVRQRRA